MATVTGTAGNDSSLSGTPGDDTMFGLGGNDWLQALQGNDDMYGGDGDDAMWGGGGFDYMEGGTGNDTYLVGEFDDAPAVIVEDAGGGTDRVHSYLYDYTLDANVENLRLVGDHSVIGRGNDLNNVITGNAFDNSLYGDIGNDTLDGGLGADTLDGGDGDDTFIIDQSDVIVDSSGNDTVIVNFNNYVLQAGMENLTLGGTVVSGTGNDADNTLTGNSGHNTFDGGLGNDTYVMGAGDVIKVDAGGTDTVRSDLTYSIATRLDLENITLTGTSAVNATGNAGANTLTGNAVNNTLDGGANTNAGDVDSLIGGFGDDIYIVHSSTDVIVENAGEGSDTVRSSASDYTLAANVETLVLMGTAAINGTGNADANVITGNSAVNVIDGGGGADTLSGGAGADTMIGGAGDDTFTVDNANDVVMEAAGGGTDTVRASVVYTLTAGQEIENLTLLGTAQSGHGNELNNIITGNDAKDTLYGGGGDDTITGGKISDRLYGEDGNDTLHGGTGVDTLDGGTGNDTLDGGQDYDTMYGGTGDDVYLVDSTRDVAIELGTAAGDQGIDTVRTSVTFTLGANIENMEWTGAAGMGTGNELDNLMTGNGNANTFSGMAGSDTLIGLEGNDTLDGGLGDDTLTGGIGNDTYIVDSLGDKVVETGTAAGDEGIDTIKSSIDYDISGAGFANIENLTLTGTTAITAIGSAGDNVLTGNTANNTLIGMEGKDTLDGGAGADTMIGGMGDDTYIVDSLADVMVETGTTAGAEGMDTIMTALTYTLAAGSNIENLTLTGSFRINGTGNELDNTLTGNTAINTLAGGDGNDTYVLTKGDVIIEVAGQGDHDVAKVDFDGYQLAANVEDLTLTGTGNIGGTGSSVANILTGNDHDNVLDGVPNTDTSTGDTLIGGLGNDTYIIHSLHDHVTEMAGQGTDLVKSEVDFDLNLNTATDVTTGIENLTLTAITALVGSGNGLNNIITGSDAANTLSGLGGNDTLDGGLGADTLIGGAGNDTYFVDNSSDTIIEAGGEGNDVVMSGVSYTLSANIEQLILTGSLAINGTGNAGDNTITGNGGINTLDGGDGNDLISGGAGNDVIFGGIGNDTIDGGIGNDTMDGGTGNDTFTVNAATDVVSGGDGNDLVLSSVTYVLASDVEQLTLTGSAKINATGNDLANVLIGNAAANTLDGGLGTSNNADTMTGGGGDDLFIVNHSTDVVHEDVGQGNDTVRTSVDYVLTAGASIENLIFTGTNDITGGGNDANNTITSNMGTDALSGGLGDDIFILNSVLDTVSENADEGKDTVMIGVGSYTLGANVENLTLTGTAAINGTGNDLDNTLTGNSGINTLTGGLGNDVYVVDAKDVIHDGTYSGGGGNDTIMAAFTANLGSVLYHNIIDNITLTGKSALNATGDEHANTLTGNDGNNILDGFANLVSTDIDTLIGGLGNDTYIVHSANDVVTEASGAGTDLVKADFDYHLSANVENLTLLGTGDISGFGNALNNTIMGTSGANTLDGGVGADTLMGGLGDDIYFVDSAADVLKDTGGHDTVHASVTYTLLTGFENLVLDGTDSINGFGNTAVNTLTGNSGNNTLDGGTGADTMSGGLGNDTYIIDSLGDKVIEAGGEGTDTVMSKLSLDLHNYANVENAILTGTANANITGSDFGSHTLIGNDGANIITAGDGGSNYLEGGAGRDTLIGGSGDDVFVFDGATAFKAVDIIENDGANDVILYKNMFIDFDPLVDVDDDYIHIKDYVVNGVTLGQNIFIDQDGTGTHYHDQLIATILF